MLGTVPDDPRPDKIFDARPHRISGIGPPHSYLGAGDRARANYTGQPAVHSYYGQNEKPATSTPGRS
jgi:hypothetical protein